MIVLVAKVAKMTSYTMLELLCIISIYMYMYRVISKKILMQPLFLYIAPSIDLLVT